MVKPLLSSVYFYYYKVFYICLINVYLYNKPVNCHKTTESLFGPLWLVIPIQLSISQNKIIVKQQLPDYLKHYVSVIDFSFISIHRKVRSNILHHQCIIIGLGLFHLHTTGLGGQDYRFQLFHLLFVAMGKIAQKTTKRLLVFKMGFKSTS